MEGCRNDSLEMSKTLQSEQSSDFERDLWFYNTHSTRTTPPEIAISIRHKNMEVLDNCTYKLNDTDCFNRTTSDLTNRQLDDVINNQNEFLLEDKESIVDNLIDSVDLSDLSFSSYNDSIFGDCSCFDDASQQIDPSTINVDSNSLSFNHANSVQLFKDNLNDSIDKVYKNEDSLNLDSLLYSKNNPDDCLRIVHGIDDLESNDNCNFYHVFELIGNSVNQNKEGDAQKKPQEIEKPIQKKSSKSKNLKNDKRLLSVPIRKGRRYLPNFKQKVLEYAASHTFKETASHFHINCNTITEWSRESKRLLLQNKSTTSMPGSVCNNKTDIDGTPVSKTDIIFLNDEFSLETETTETSFENIEDLPPCNMRSDERFLKWIQNMRLEKKQLTRNEVLNAARHCLNKTPQNSEKPLWFMKWFQRYCRALQTPVKTTFETEKYIMYPNHFKLEVALYARAFTKNLAARVFNVPRRRMFDWYNLLNPLNDSFLPQSKNEGFVSDDSDVSSKKGVTCDTYKDKSKDEIYSELCNWYQDKLIEGSSPTSIDIKAKAKQVFAANGVNDIKFSEGWLQKFCKRSNIKLRHNGDGQLLLWILSQFDKNISLSHQQITLKSSELMGMRKEFKGSKGWTLRFLKRHSNYLQQVPGVKDKLPEIAQVKVENFCKEIERSLSNFGVQSSNFGCMDEIPIGFNYPQDEKSVHLPLLRKTGFENCQAIVILSSTADGRILPPAVVFKGNGPKQILSDQNVDMLIMYQQNGLVDSEIINAWYHDVWRNCVLTPNVLVIDSFEPHASAQFRQITTKDNCILSVIPEGCSSQLLPFNFETTPLFHELIKKQWRQYSSNLASHVSKTVNRCQCPDQDTILHWIRFAFQEIQQNPNSIINSFKITGLLK